MSLDRIINIPISIREYIAVVRYGLRQNFDVKLCDSLTRDAVITTIDDLKSFTILLCRVLKVNIVLWCMDTHFRWSAGRYAGVETLPMFLYVANLNPL